MNEEEERAVNNNRYRNINCNVVNVAFQIETQKKRQQ